MKKKLIDLLDRMSNVGTFVGVLGLIAILVNQYVGIDIEGVNTTINIVASILLALGFLNNPSGNFKPYIPFISDPKVTEIE